jgi:hypothetical protein
MSAAEEVCQLAKNLARNGFAVFPCTENKRPTTPNGYKDAASDPDEIAELWRNRPGPLIVVATGVRSGIDVLDIDVKHPDARAWFVAASNKIPPTRIYQTRGGGFHLTFRHADGVRNTESVLARGVDTRGDGGYAIWWWCGGYPCLDHSPVAQWPEWLFESLLYKPEPVPLTKPFHNNGNAPLIITRSLARLASAPDGTRHATLRAAACTLGGLMQASNLPSTEASRLLLDAVIQAGGARVDQRNALGTINWGLSRGAASPLQLEVR